LLATNTCISYINRKNMSVFQHIITLSPEDIGIYDILKFELYYGADHSSRVEENLENLRKFFGDFVSLPFGDRVSRLPKF
jgi:tRNA(fMet)-specific endonuclease VapC